MSRRSSDGVRMRFSARVGYAYRTRLDSPPLAPKHAPAIRRLTWSDLLYFLGHVVGRMCIPELLFLCFFGEVVRAGARLELSFCPGHAVVYRIRQPHYAQVVWAPTPHRRIGVAAYAPGNSFLGARGHILRLPGH